MRKEWCLSLCFLFFLCVPPLVAPAAFAGEQGVKGKSPSARVPGFGVPHDALPAESDGSDRMTLPDTADFLSHRARVFVRRFEIEGNTVFPPEALAAVTSPYEGREITSEELQDVRQELTHLYIRRGYITSGVIIPDQEISGGIITLRVVEGWLSRIEIEGNRYLLTRYLHERIARAAHAPLDINRLQQSLQTLQQDSRIRRVNAELGPGIMPGEGVLKVRVEEEKPVKAFLSFGNTRPPGTGAYRGEGVVVHQSLFGWGDVLEGRFGMTEGNSDFGVTYTVPVTARDTAVSVSYRKGESTVIEQGFRDLDIRSESATFGTSLRHPLFRTPEQEFALVLSGELRREKTFLLGQPFSFSEVPEATTHATVLRFAQEWVRRSRTEVLAVRSGLSLGIDAFGATVSGTGADGRFFAWLGQVQWIRHMAENGMQMVFRSDIQLTGDALLPMEKFPVGGLNSVRGYRENQLVRDNGAAGSLELRVPLLRNDQGDAIVQFAPFADFGWSKNARKDTPSPRSIASVGAGIRWAITPKGHFQLYAGYPLKKLKNTGHDLQDEGVHFQLIWQVL